MTRFWTFYWVEVWCGNIALTGPQSCCDDKEQARCAPVCWRVFALLFSSLSLSPDSHSVRPSVSQSAGQVWFGHRVQKKRKQIFPAEFSFASSCMLCSLYFSSLFCSVIFFYLCNFIKYFSYKNFPVSELLRSRQERGEEREGDCVAFKSI